MAVEEVVGEVEVAKEVEVEVKVELGPPLSYLSISFPFSTSRSGRGARCQPHEGVEI